MARSVPLIPVQKTVSAMPCGLADHARFLLDAYTMTPLKLAVLPALLALTLCQTTTAGTTASASFQASLVVHDVCSVSTLHAPMQVQCRHNTPYLLHQHATPSGGGLVTVTF